MSKREHTKDTDTCWLSVSGRTFLLRRVRDVTPQEMFGLDLSSDRAAEYVAGIPPGLNEHVVYERRHVLPPRGPIPKLSHKKLWNLGRQYASYSAPHIVQQAEKENYPLPARKHTELFPVLKSVYELLEREQGVVWDDLLASMQDDFLVGFWNRLRELRILEK